MKEEKILNSIRDSVNHAPIDLLETIKVQDIPKMLKHDEITRQKQAKGILKTIVPMVSLVAILIMVFGLWQFQYRTPDSYVYLDVNPSIEIITNKRDEVINILSHNSDGDLLADEIEFKGRDMVLVTEEIIKNMIDLDYIESSEDYILLSVYNKNQEKQSTQQRRLNTSIRNYIEKEELLPIILIQNLEKTSTIEKYANEYGISLSKMTFIRNMIVLNPELEVEDLVDSSLKELIIISQSMELNLKNIIESDDFERIPEYNPIENNDHEDIESNKDNLDTGNDSSNLLEKRIISVEEARRIALSLTGGGTIKSVNLDDDDDDDEAEYEIEIIKDGIEYEIEIDAYTGRILDFDKDDED